MSHYEYTVVPAPRQAPRVKGIRATDARYAHGLADVLNLHGLDGWEFQRTETMVAECRKGVFGRRSEETVSVLVFRRWVETGATSGLDARPATGPGHVPAPAPGEPARPNRLAAARRPEINLRSVPAPGRD